MEPQYNEIGRAGSYTDSPDNIILTSPAFDSFQEKNYNRSIFSSDKPMH